MADVQYFPKLKLTEDWLHHNPYKVLISPGLNLCQYKAYNTTTFLPQKHLWAAVAIVTELWLPVRLKNPSGEKLIWIKEHETQHH